MTMKYTIDINIEETIQQYIETQAKATTFDNYIQRIIMGRINAIMEAKLDAMIEDFLEKEGNGITLKTARMVCDVYGNNIAERIKKFIDEKFTGAVDRYLTSNAWRKCDTDVDRYIRQKIRDTYYPMLDTIIKKTIVVNTIDIDEEMAGLHDAVDAARDEAYNAGRAAGDR